MKKMQISEDSGPFSIEPKRSGGTDPGFRGLQRPIKIQQQPMEPRGQDESAEDYDQWIRSITEKAKNPQFGQVVEILKNDKELEPLLYDHRELLEALSTMRGLSSKQMLSIISAAEKEYYECSHNYREKPKEEAPASASAGPGDNEAAEKTAAETQELTRKLGEEAQLRKKAEDELAELRRSKNEEGTVSLRMTNQNLMEENQGLTRMLNEQSKYLKEVERLQQDVLAAKSERQSALKSKEKLEEDFDKNTKMIDDLRQEISMLQQEKDNLTRKLASTVRSQLGSTAPARRTGTAKYTTPLKALEESKASRAASTGPGRPLKRSQSFDSSLRYNRELAALLMDSKGTEPKAEPIRLADVSEEKPQSSQVRMDSASQPRPDLVPTTYCSTHHPDQMTLSLISGPPKPREEGSGEPKTEKKESRHTDSRLEHTLENERLHNAIRELRQENRNLTCKLQEVEKKWVQQQPQQIQQQKPSLFGSDISRIAPTFAGSTPPQAERLFGDSQSSPFARNFQSKHTESRGPAKLVEIISLLEDLGDTLKLRLDNVQYDREKEPLENVKEYLRTLKQQAAEKEQVRELETAVMEGKRVKEKTRQWREDVERLESELGRLREENETLKKQKYLAESAKMQADMMSGSGETLSKLRQDNLELLGKYEKIVNENYELRFKLRDATMRDEELNRSLLKRTMVESPAKDGIAGQLLDYKIRMDEQLLREKERNAKFSEAVTGLKERNELLKEELSLHRDRNRQLERELLRYVKKTTNLSQEATVNKHNYKSMAANHAHMSHKLKELQRENKTLKKKVNVTQSPVYCE